MSKKKCDGGTEAIPQQEFPECFQQWHYLWTKYITAQGESFEGDPSQ
jgi:hypothetical protein